MDEPQKAYQALARERQHQLRRQQQINARLSFARVVSVLTAFSGLYFLWYQQAGWAYFPLFAGLIGFFFFLQKHGQGKARSRLLRAELEQLALERKALQGQNSPWHSTGETFRRAEHPYSEDLDLFGPDSLYHQINRCFSPAGEKALAAQLLEPPPDYPAWQKAAQSWRGKNAWLLRFRALGSPLRGNPDFLPRWETWCKAGPPANWSQSAWLLYPLAVLTVGALLYWWWIPTVPHFYLFLSIFGLNNLLSGSRLKVLRTQSTHLGEMGQTLEAYGALLEHLQGEPGARSPAEPLPAKAAQALKKLSRISRGLDQMNNLLVWVLFNGLFHYHLHLLRQLQRWHRAGGEEKGQWLRQLSRAELRMCLATFAHNRPHYVFPASQTTPGLQFRDLRHPLLRSQKAVGNDGALNGGQFVVLTGSNMSGKSTFLRSLGLALVMHRAGLPVCAAEWSAYPFRLISSMKLNDSVREGRSFFQSEVLRLKTIRQAAEAEEPLFVLLDEILRGTNSEDKRKGTRAYLQSLQKLGATGVLATHDVDIAELREENPAFLNWYFDSKVAEGALQFDYRMREGVCRKPNATQLMRNEGII